MKVRCLTWLQEFAPFPDDADLIGDTFDRLGTPVEAVEHLGGEWDGIVVARVEALRRAPRRRQDPAGRRRRRRRRRIQIVCGAFNMAVGDLVPLATRRHDHARRHGDRPAQDAWASESNGMLCSSRELGPRATSTAASACSTVAAAPGTPLAEALGVVPDVLWDLEINPNRPDAMSVAGLARDLAAALDLPFTLPSPEGHPDRRRRPPRRSTVEIADPDLCGRFGAWVLRNVVDRHVARLDAAAPDLALGMRPDQRAGRHLELRDARARPAEPPLRPRPGAGRRPRRPPGPRGRAAGHPRRRRADLHGRRPADLRRRATQPVGIAGIMGGASCEISPATTDVLLEMAWFQPWAVSRTVAPARACAREASARFEKGCDPEGIPLAAARFCELAADICGATVAPGAVDVRGELPDPAAGADAHARVNAAARHRPVGRADPGRARADRVRVHAGPPRTGRADHDVIVPSWRYDCAVEIDVVEEVARHWGYDRIERRPLTSARTGRLTPDQKARREVRRLLRGLGLAEVLPLPFLAPGDLERCGLAPVGITLTNPLVAEESVLRTSLLPGPGQGGRAQPRPPRPPASRCSRSATSSCRRPTASCCPTSASTSPSLLAGARGARRGRGVAGARRPAAGRGTVGASATSARASTRRAARWRRSPATAVGAVGEIDPGVLDAFGIDERVAWLELDLGRAARRPRRPRRPTARSAASRRATSTSPSRSPDEVSAIDLERDPRRHRPAGLVRAALRHLPRPAGRRGPPQPGLPRPPPGRGPHPHRRGGGGGPHRARRRGRGRARRHPPGLSRCRGASRRSTCSARHRPAATRWPSCSTARGSPRTPWPDWPAGRTSPRRPSSGRPPTHGPTTRCASSPRAASSTSPGTRPSAPATPGCSRAGGRPATTWSCSSPGPGWCRCGRARRSPSRRRRPPGRSPTRSALDAVLVALGIDRGAVVGAAVLDNGTDWLTLRAHRRGRGPGPGARPRRAAVAAQGRRGRDHRGGDPALEVRAFAASVGIAEDPVTGSLQASAAQWLIDEGRLPARYVAAQGRRIGRDGRVLVERADGEVWVGGATDTVVAGTIEL